MDDKANVEVVAQSIYDSWDEEWRKIDDLFEFYLRIDDKLGVLIGKSFRYER